MINIIIGANSCGARVTASFADIGITAGNTAIIFLINGGQLLSYSPTRSINPITGIEAGKGYYLIAKQAMDLTTYFTPPIPDCPPGGDLSNVLLTGSGQPVNTGDSGWDLAIANAGNLQLVTNSGAPLVLALSSPDGTAWEIKKTTAGAIQVDSSTAIAGVPSVQRTSPDGSVWTITISNTGVLSQSKP